MAEAEPSSDPGVGPLPEGAVPAQVVARSEQRWLVLMTLMLITMLAVIVLSSAFGAAHLGSNVEVIQPSTLHLAGEFVESNLGTALEPDGSATVRIIAQQYDFVPHCVQVPAGVPVRFRLTSADVVHGFLLPETNVNTMVVPGFVAEVRTQFSQTGVYEMACHEFCGLGHHGMWTQVVVVDKDSLELREPLERLRCAKQ